LHEVQKSQDLQQCPIFRNFLKRWGLVLSLKTTVTKRKGKHFFHSINPNNWAYID
jgi:hypothetical protein